MASALLGVSTAPGAVSWYAVNSVPQGWLACNGAAISRTAYARLFAAIGTTYGVGDGSTTFNVPDMRGEFIRGHDAGRNVDIGRAFGSAQADQVQGHYHEIFSLDGAGALLGLAYNASRGGAGAVNTAANRAGNLQGDGANGSPRVGQETRSRNVAMLACIKY